MATSTVIILAVVCILIGVVLIGGGIAYLILQGRDEDE